MLSVDAFSKGTVAKLDGSSVVGFTGVEESDLVLEPVPETLVAIPWEPGAGRLLCCVYREGRRFEKDPRYIAEKLDSTLASAGLKPLVSAELEYFLFDRVSVFLDPWRQGAVFKSREAYWSRGAPFNRPKDAYYAVYPRDGFEEFKIELTRVLRESFGLKIEGVHHEVAPAQHEVTFEGGTVTYAGDTVQTVKYVIKALAHRKGLVATFMPKPLYGDNGSGMHVHVSLWSGSSNLFYDPSDKYMLSDAARYFIGGLIEHGRALAAFTNPTVNSYKRLVPGYEAPVYLVWGKANRSAAIRVPGYATTERSMRVEYRPPDPSANPYLALAAIMLAGLDGIHRKISPGNPVEENVYKMPMNRRAELGIKSLPRSLDEALDELECDNEWLKPVFPRDLLETYIELKREEARRVSSYPSPAEVYFYVDI